MSVAQPFNLKKWIDENRHLLKPPVGNQQVFKLSEDYIVMVVGGPNARKDYHFEDGEELFYQLEGDITVKIQQDGKPVDMHVKEGEMFLLPPHIYHCPQRPANTIGLVIERVRKEAERDSCVWFCENCNNKMHEEVFALKDIVVQLPALLNKFYSTPELHTCKKCGTVMQPPGKLN
ncbi:MAG: 3-hydroxyanthranilate 3,4-dioxygenase [Bacteroidia bacterium]